MPPADLIDRIREGLSEPGRPSSDYDLNADVVLPQGRKITPAAVLIPIFEREDELELILTKRSPRLQHHPGQIAFPGGKQENDDPDIVQTALREAREEIGLSEKNVDILGSLPPHETVTGFSVAPIVAQIREPFAPVADISEVAEIFTVPLSHVVEPGNFFIEGRRWRGKTRYYYTVPYGPYYIWGATARMLRAFADQVNK